MGAPREKEVTRTRLAAGETKTPAASTADEKMIGLLAYVHYERRGVELNPGKH